MDELVKGVFTAPLATLFIISGMIFLLIAVIDNISGKIDPGLKARIASGIFGLAFILVGISIHVMQSGLNPSALSTASSTSTKPDQPLKTPATVKSDIRASPVSEQRGSESPKKETLYAQLIDEISGESWGELHYGGDVGCHMKQNLAMGQSHVAWMKFKISNPEKKKFAFSLPIGSSRVLVELVFQDGS